ncbi:MAG: sugar phosphate isomerase/epimerase [Planctomycetes bacterium]|nr:sugar phosphate isomerase/epimerase [Planctomycetota bacterium]
MQLALSQVCSLDSGFAQDVEDYAAGKCRAIEIWMTKLESFIEANSLDAVRRLLEEHQVAAPAAAFQGGLLTSQGDARREAWDLFARRLDLCRELGIEVLIVACDAAPLSAQQDLERVRVSLRQAAEEAQRREVRLALEPQAKASVGNNLQTAAALVEEVSSPHLGLCLDVFHYYVGPSKAEDLGLLSRDNLFHVQLCDLADTPREFAADGDRILPGDGDIPLQPILDRLDQIGYDRCVSIELMNPSIWRIPPRQFGEIGITALRMLFGQAEP